MCFIWDWFDSLWMYRFVILVFPEFSCFAGCCNMPSWVGSCLVLWVLVFVILVGWWLLDFLVLITCLSCYGSRGVGII